MTADVWPFGDLRPFTYGAIVADPPWRFATFSGKGEGKSPQQHYTCMSLDAIKALPVASLAAPNCALLLWATAPMLPQALETLAAWGFAYKSAAAWAKQSRTGKKWAFGTGFIYRSAAEFLILGTRGKPKPRARNVRNLIVAPVREHSRKPDHAFRDGAALYDGPYCELFARERRPGWDAWGNEIGRFPPPGAAPGHPAVSSPTASAGLVPAGAPFHEVAPWHDD